MKNSNLIKEIVNTGRLFKSVFIRTAEHGTKSDIRPSEKNALMELSGHKELSMSALNKKLSVSKQQLTAITGSLRKKRYVERYTDDRNLRVAHVRITDEGRKVLRITYSEAERKLSNKLEYLSSGEIQELESSIKTLKKLLEKMNR